MPTLYWPGKITVWRNAAGHEGGQEPSVIGIGEDGQVLISRHLQAVDCTYYEAARVGPWILAKQAKLEESGLAINKKSFSYTFVDFGATALNNAGIASFELAALLHSVLKPFSQATYHRIIALPKTFHSDVTARGSQANMSAIQMYERLQKADDEEAAEHMPEERGQEARAIRKEATRKNMVFLALLFTNLVTLLVALYLAQKLYRMDACAPGSGQGSGLEGKPLGTSTDTEVADSISASGITDG